MKTRFLEFNVKQCYLARDEYIIRDLERNMENSEKEEFIRMGDINQRQKVCLMLVIDDLELLKHAYEAELQGWKASPRPG